LNDDQLLRYSRHILLDEIGIEAQERLLASRICNTYRGSEADEPPKEFSMDEIRSVNRFLYKSISTCELLEDARS